VVWEHAAVGAVLFVLTILVFRHILAGSFLNWDDLTMVVKNERLITPTLGGLRRFWTEFDTGFLALYTPMAYTVWWCLAWCFGLTSPVPFHAANLLLHACNVVLAYMLLRRLLGEHFAGSRITMGAALGACLYAVHPMQAEPVCWISGFNNIIAATFALYALVRLYDAVRSRTRTRIVLNYLFASVGLLLAYCCKPTALVTPLIAAVLCLLVLRLPVRRVALWLLPWFLLMLPFIWIGQRAQNASYMPPPLYQRMLVVADTISYYSTNVVIPWRISADYGRTPEFVLDRWASQPLWPLAGAIALACILFWRRFRWLAVAVAVSVVAIAPTSGVTPFFFQSLSTVADRYFYLAMLGPSLLLGAIVCLWPDRRAIAVWTCVLAVLGAMSLHASIRWQSTYYWAAGILRTNPGSVIGNLCMAFTLSADRYFDEARPYFDAASKTSPGHPRLLLGLGMYYLDTDKPGDAVTCMMFLLKENPHFREAYPIMAAAAIRNGTPQLGIMAMDGVVAHRPYDAQAYAYLGSLHAVMKHDAEARGAISHALELDPDDSTARRFMEQLEAPSTQKAPEADQLKTSAPH
jgi:protein O-mannosyl-transferase